jgi:hypoxanthine-DNA glycosylase
MIVRSLAPRIAASSRVLVLGSMPGKVSLAAGEYYAHPRNLFWPLMEQLLGIDRAAPYERRVAALLRRGVALWDVLETCMRTSSLDSDIVASSIVANDFPRLLARHQRIRVVCFNGAKAAASFRRHVLPQLPDAQRIAFHDLPSTSPANAVIPFTRKLAAWRVVAPAKESRRS